jgi:hypothetical protein
MVMNLVFWIGGKGIFMIRIDGKEVYWNDTKSGLQMLYPNPSEKALEIGGEPSEEELEEYNMCSTEEELASFVIRDCRKKGIKLIKKEKK